MVLVRDLHSLRCIVFQSKEIQFQKIPACSLLIRGKLLENPWVPVFVACFLWWFLTGVILFVVNWADTRGARYHKLVTLGLLPILVVGFYGFLFSVDDSSVSGIYLAFISSLCIWGWLELAFLTGVVTGPNRVEKPVGVNGFKRFRLAWEAVAYSELTLAGVLLVLFLLSYRESNWFGFLTFLVLYVARLSAKLNLFLGVPKINIEFLPARVGHLASHFKVSGTSWFFPLSLIILSGVLVYWLNSFRTASEVSQTVGFCFLMTLTGLAILEHFFMILSMHDAALWRWMIPKSTSSVKAALKQGETFTE